MLQDHNTTADGHDLPATDPTEADKRRARRIRHDLFCGAPVKIERMAWLAEYERRWPAPRRRRAAPRRRARPPTPEQVGLERILDAVLSARVVVREGRRIVAMEVDADSPLFRLIDTWCEEQETRPTTLEPAWSEGSRR